MSPTLAINLPLAILLGAISGSFLTTATLRAAAGRRWASGRSSCDHCGTLVQSWRNVPILAFVALKGRCASCKAPIAWVHLAGELAGAVVGVSLIQAHGWTVAGMGGLGAALIVLSVFDLVTLRLPSALNLIVAICCAGLAWSEHNLVAGLVTAAVWYGLLSLVSVVFRKRYGRDGLGAGDIKLIAALAIYGGPLMTSILVAVAASTALILVRLAPKTLGPSAKLPFGPFLAASAWCVFAIQLGAPP